MKLTLGQLKEALASSVTDKDYRGVIVKIGKRPFDIDSSVGFGQDEVTLLADLGREIQVGEKTFERPEYIFIKEGWIWVHHADGREEQLTWKDTHLWANRLGQLGIPFRDQ
jgi:hypothetical protein